MRKFLLFAAAVVAAGLVVVAAAGAATVRGINPIYVKGNPDCKDLAGLTSSTQAKFVAPVNGANNGVVYLLIDSTNIQWYVLRDIADADVKAVIVKGGSGANVYLYPGGDYSDGGLTTPLNKGGKAASLGYMTVCYTTPS